MTEEEIDACSGEDCRCEYCAAEATMAQERLENESKRAEQEVITAKFVSEFRKNRGSRKGLIS